MRNSPLHVLLIEDSEDDAELIMAELSNTFPAIFSERVETLAEMSVVLKRGQWDVVISDFSLPRFDAHKALAELRRRGEDIPFIVVSGCIGEDRAVALMREGASDFIAKNKLARLAPAIERELREVAVRDERRQAQKRLHENERLLKGLTAALGEGLFVLNSAGALFFMNPEAERLLGWTFDEVRGENIHRIIHARKPDGAPLPEHKCKILGVLQDGRTQRVNDDIFVCKDGSLMPVSFVASAIVNDGRITAVVTAFQDISQHKQAERNLLESREQLRELSAHLQTVREKERARIARELHDQLGQMLTGIKLDALWLSSHLPQGQPGVDSKMAAMSRLIDDTLDAMRRVAADLRPTMLDDLGLAAAIEWLADDFSGRTGIEVILETGLEEETCGLPEEGGMDPQVATAAFRIVQECLTNVARHAGASHVLISLDCHKEKLMLMLSDNGKGLPGLQETRPSSYGMIGMRERAYSLGGTFDTFSVPGEGVAVVVVLPMKPFDWTEIAP